MASNFSQLLIVVERINCAGVFHLNIILLLNITITAARDLMKLNKARVSSFFHLKIKFKIINFSFCEEKMKKTNKRRARRIEI
jgi:hypothetical protein